MIFRKNHKVTCSLYSHIFLPNFSWNLPHTRALLLLFLLLIGDQQIYRPVLTEPVLRNIESLYESCCSLGKTAAYTIGLNGPDNSVGEETCASVLQLEISAPLQSADAEQHREFSRRFWCQRVKHLCCVSSRRTRACHIGSEHILKHHEHNCSAKAFRNLVESRFIGVAKVSMFRLDEVADAFVTICVGERYKV
ncbi:hypothetical protein FBUS_03175 [Fasciolopsis buskii]|uniref:Uncharacterized protein n=1 Tax=Fasciolopsis buskii TaxID=27845 RepID=A0A8E0VMI2_9TREM|nr:hypothetical protein FBUS_03175 [Fasciolopsis buski]